MFALLSVRVNGLFTDWRIVSKTVPTEDGKAWSALLQQPPYLGSKDHARVGVTFYEELLAVDEMFIRVVRGD